MFRRECVLKLALTVGQLEQITADTFCLFFKFASLTVPLESSVRMSSTVESCAVVRAVSFG